MRNVRRLAGGSSRQVWSLDARLEESGGPRELALVLRIDPTGGREGSATGLAGEFRLLEVAHRNGVPVPRVLWQCEDPELLGGACYFMERIEGETIPSRIFRSEELATARERLPDQLGRALAQIHAVDPEAEGLGLSGPAPSASAPETQLAQLRAGIDLAPSPSPTVELAFRWLEQNVPPEQGRTLVHGDFRIGNVIVGADGLRAILDWELAHIGDPHEDLAWMCTKTWRFGQIDRPVGGIGAREPFYRAYEAASDRSLDRAALRYWEVLGSVKVATVWILQVRAYLSGIIPSVEQAAIGRRMAETELDLLQLLDAEG